MNTQTIPAVRRGITVNAPAKRAFDVFTRSMVTWWPAPNHIGETDPAAIVIEEREGGRWYERGSDDKECDWGRVLAWEPPHRLVLAWHLNGAWEFDADPSHASEVEITFTAEGPDRTRVDLEHRGFERHGETGGSLRDAVDSSGGWGVTLDQFATAAQEA
jgi:uncharacterized protein YndB with AHSA1/START domain